MPGRSPGSAWLGACRPGSLVSAPAPAQLSCGGSLVAGPCRRWAPPKHTHARVSVLLHCPTGCMRLASSALVVETSVIPATWITPLESSLSSRYPRAGFSRSRIISL